MKIGSMDITYFGGSLVSVATSIMTITVPSLGGFPLSSALTNRLYSVFYKKKIKQGKITKINCINYININKRNLITK